MNKYLAAARTILTKAPDGLHYEEITRRALDRGLVTTSGKTPEASMNAQLAMAIKREGARSVFQCVRPGVYALKATARAEMPAPASAMPHLAPMTKQSRVGTRDHDLSHYLNNWSVLV